MEQPFPLVSEELITALERLYPDRCPVPEMSVREVWMAAGRASVVRKLKAEYKRQVIVE